MVGEGWEGGQNLTCTSAAGGITAAMDPARGGSGR